jgi:hypothetical protein
MLAVARKGRSSDLRPSSISHDSDGGDGILVPPLRDDPARVPCSLTDVICLTRSGFRSSRCGSFSAGSAQALAGEFDALGVMNEAVQDRVGVVV